MLAQVVDALALVRLRRTLGTDLGGNLADLLLVDALDVDVGVVRALEGDALRGGVDHRVRVTQGQIQVLALELNTVANAGELEDLGVALGDAAYKQRLISDVVTGKVKVTND